MIYGPSEAATRGYAAGCHLRHLNHAKSEATKKRAPKVREAADAGRRFGCHLSPAVGASSTDMCLSSASCH
jgi:hypothetical protein